MSEIPAPLQEDFPALYKVLGHPKMPDMHFDQLEPLLAMAVLIQENLGALEEYGRAERDAGKIDEIARELQDLRARVKGTLAFFEDAISSIPLPAELKFPGFDPKAVDLLSTARADPRRAQEALAHAAQIIDAGDPLPLPISKWVSEAFVAASKPNDGPSAANVLGKMLNLVGKKTKTTFADPVLVAGEIMEHHNDGKGLKIEDAYAQVSKTFGITENLAEDYYTKKNKELYIQALKASRES